MATLGQWVQGARPRTLPAAIAPVLVGTAVAWTQISSIFALGQSSQFGWFAYSPLQAEGTLEAGAGPWESFVDLLKRHGSVSIHDLVIRALFALVVALALQVGVNYANDYSDGIRGTDEVRVGPIRLVGQRLAAPAAVKAAAFAAFGIAAAAGLILVFITQQPWLIAVGAAAILAAWFYTGGPSPYGYAGLGEIFVFVFFGLVAVMGSTYIQTLQGSWLALAGGVATGALSVAILLVNNLRDIPTDRLSGKRTLAVRIGDPATRLAFTIAIATPFAIVLGIAATGRPWALVGLAALPLAIRPIRTVRGGASARDLIPALAGTAQLLLAYSVLLSLGLVLSS